MDINPDIFKAYDIRGKIPGEIDEDVAERIGRAASSYFSQEEGRDKLKFFVCMDVRTSSPSLKEAIIKGIISQGNDVVDVGVGTTPFFYFLMSTEGPDAGIMVTASHNPPEYNGFKIRGKGSRPVSLGSGLEKIRDIVLGQPIQEKGKGNILPPEDHRDKYVNFLASQVNSLGKPNVVLDTSGGSVGFFLSELLKKFSEVNHKDLFFEAEGSFKNHSPNPLLPESRKFVKEELLKSSYDFGALFDGDGDRVVFFDEKGNAIRPDYVVGIFAKYYLYENPGASFVLPVNSSKGVREYIQSLGGKVFISKVGYINVTTLMKQEEAVCGGELSGHFYFKDFFYDESGLFAWLKISEILSSEGRPLSMLMEPFEAYVTSEEINFKVQDKEQALAKIKDFYKGINFGTLDGLTAEFKDWWFNIRPSNTEPIMRLVLEANSQKLFEEKRKELESLLS